MNVFSLQDEVKATQLENGRVMHRSLPAASGTIRVWNRTSNIFRESMINPKSCNPLIHIISFQIISSSLQGMVVNGPRNCSTVLEN